MLWPFSFRKRDSEEEFVHGGPVNCCDKTEVKVITDVSDTHVGVWPSFQTTCLEGDTVRVDLWESDGDWGGDDYIGNA